MAVPSSSQSPCPSFSSYSSSSSTKFQESGFTVHHSTVRSEAGNLLSGITVCPFQANPRTPWRNATAKINDPDNILAIECNVSTGREALDCIREKTDSNVDQVVYNISDVLSLPKPEITLKSKYSGGGKGTCQTLTYPHPIATSHYKEAFMMLFNPNISFDIFLPYPNKQHFFLIGK